MHDHTNNVAAGAGIALASLGSLFAQAQPGSISMAGSIIALAFVLIRAVQEIAVRWLAVQAQRADATHTEQALADCEKKHADNILMIKKGRCPLAENGEFSCIPGFKG